MTKNTLSIAKWMQGKESDWPVANVSLLRDCSLDEISAVAAKQ